MRRDWGEREVILVKSNIGRGDSEVDVCKRRVVVLVGVACAGRAVAVTRFEARRRGVVNWKNNEGR